MLRTVNDHMEAMQKLAGRGVIFENSDFFGMVFWYVPLWKVDSVKRAIHEFVPIGVRVEVKPLSILQHFTLWRVAHKKGRAA